MNNLNNYREKTLAEIFGTLEKECQDLAVQSLTEATNPLRRGRPESSLNRAILGTLGSLIFGILRDQHAKASAIEIPATEVIDESQVIEHGFDPLDTYDPLVDF